MKIKKVDDKPMVIHTKQKAEIYTHEPKQASIKENNIYMVERGTKTKSTLHQAGAKDKGLSRFKQNIRESNVSIKTKQRNLHIAGRTGVMAVGMVNAVPVIAAIAILYNSPFALIPFVSFAISPDFWAISIRPTHNAMTPIIVIHKDTASPAESRAAFVTSAIFPVKAPYTTPVKIINAQI